MTMRTYTHFVCPNDHRGFKRVSENDQPYSRMWESTTTDDISEVTGPDGTYYVCATCGEGVTVTEKPKA